MTELNVFMKWEKHKQKMLEEKQQCYIIKYVDLDNFAMNESHVMMEFQAIMIVF